MRLLRQPLFLAVALSHFWVDVLNGQVGVLLAVLSAPLLLSNAAIGLIATLYSLLGSLTQPLFGWLADRHGARWATAGGVVWMAACFGLVAVAPGAWALGWMMLGALGSAAFHPPGTMKAAQAGRQFMAGQVATAASVFFLFGQGGLSAGPALGGVILEYLGRGGLLLLSAVTLGVGVFTAWQMRPLPARALAGGAAARAAEADPDQRCDLRLFAVVMTLASLRTAAQTIVTTFAPKFLQDQGVAPSVYGAVVGVFMGCSAIGGVLGGVLADRWGRGRTVGLALALSVGPLYLLPLASGAWIFLLAALAGLFNGAPHSVFITLAQRALPGRAALASGLTLGLMFTAGTLGAYVGGLAGDRVGLGVVLHATAALAALAGVVLVIGGRRMVQGSRQ
jgi:FSR family fosmidomycin resistance protein-like MFS transporter